MKTLLLSITCVCLACQPLIAQHEHHKGMKMGTTRSPEKMGAMQMPMNHSYSLHLPMNRNGSGTSWLPDASPMYGYMFHSSKWMYMVHGNLFLRYTNQDIGRKGGRGGDKFDAPNWFMLMAQRKVGRRGLFHYEVMLSFDRLTEGGAGYPLLFQSGESWKGQPLVDRQHPHDLFSGLSVGYSYALSKNADIYASFGYPGEPALGSVAFMHRPSAMNNPDAPISHHWNDGTHITFGVATLGVRLYDFKLEGSVFTGREPDENRYDFDRMRFDSWSSRLSYNPSRNWALQVSHGHIKSPELLHPDEDIDRTTASAIFSLPLQENNHLNITGLWGLNKSKGHTGENALLLEGALNIKRVAVYTRYEWVQKSTEELDLDAAQYGGDNLFSVHALTGGVSYDLLRAMHTRLAVGVQGSVYFNEKALHGLYGKNPLAGEVYLRLYPDLMKP
nr:hypothetical protein [uncultured Chitinophaga sp.]